MNYAEKAFAPENQYMLSKINARQTLPGICKPCVASFPENLKKKREADCTIIIAEMYNHGDEIRNAADPEEKKEKLLKLIKQELNMSSQKC